MKEISPVKKRLIDICNAMDISPNYFSKEIGRTREYISKINKEIGSEALRNICHRFPEINILWIITGEGEMFLPKEDNIPIDTKLIVKLLEEERNALKDLRLKCEQAQEERETYKDEISHLNIEIAELRAKLDAVGLGTSKAG